MSGQGRALLLVILTLGAAALGDASCGGDSAKPDGGRFGGSAGHGEGGAGRDGGGGTGHDGGSTDAASCPAASDLTVEPPPVQVALDSGVPLDQFLHALAVARCQYLSRCFALSTYVANDCVEQLVNDNSSFDYPPSGVTITYLDSSSALAQAAAAGAAHYDPQKEGPCLAAQLAEGCSGYELVVNLAPCAGVFTCPSGPDGGAGPIDGGSADGGASCAQLVSFYDHPVHTCSTDQDCAGDADASQNPYCAGGVCVPWRCGYFPISGIEGCTSLATAGEACLSNAFSNLNAAVAPDAMCAPGLMCQGASRDGGTGTCVVPVDVDGTCTDDTNCKPGLACACGICEIPPTTGPCVNGLCEVGVAYCDRVTHTCHPLRGYGASCADADNSCALGLVCDAVFSVCESQR